MIFLIIYPICLMIAPQLWVKPIEGLPVDVIIYPVWTVYLFAVDGIKSWENSNNKYIIVFFAWLVLSSIVNNSLAVQDKDIGYLIVYYIKLLWLFFLVSYTLKSEKRINVFFGAISIIGIVLAIEGIQHKLTGIGWAGQTLGWTAPEVLATGGSGRTRWIGIFDGPGVFCVIYVISFPFLLFAFEQQKSVFFKSLSLFMIPTLGLAIYFNGSRGGMLAVLAILALHYGKKMRVAKWKAILGLVFILLFYMSLPANLTEINDSSKSTYHRIEMWKEGFEMMLYNPVFGIGRGNFALYTSKLKPHNSAILILGELGFPGLLAWVVLIYMSIKNVVCYVLDTANDLFQRQFATAVLLSLLGYLAAAMFVDLEYETFYLLLGVCSAYGAFVNKRIKLSNVELIYILLSCFGFVAFIYAYSEWFLRTH